METIIPSYKIGLVPEKYTTDKNKPFNIIVKISGAGTVINAKLTAYSDLNVRLAAYKNGKQEKDYDYRADHYFFSVPNEGFKEREGFKEYSSPALIYEFAHDHNVAHVRAKALSDGDHVIHFIFSYTPDGVNWYSDRLEFKFHVNTIMDKYGWGVLIIGSISLILTFIGLIFRQEVLTWFQTLFSSFKSCVYK